MRDVRLAKGTDARDPVHRSHVRSWLENCGDLYATFTRLYTNGDGNPTVHVGELGALANNGEVEKSTTVAIMTMANTDQDGKISLAEFLELGRVLQEVAELKVAVLGGVSASVSYASIETPVKLFQYCTSSLYRRRAPVRSRREKR